MSLVALASAKASPGVTTAAVVLALGWPPARRVVVAELDGAGGDLAAWLGLAPEPGLVSLAAATRRGPDGNTVLSHAQRRSDGPPVVAAPPAASQAATAAAMCASSVISTAAGHGPMDVLADCGRLPSSPSEIMRAADAVLLLARPTLAEARHLAAAVDSLSQAGCRPLLVAVGDRPYRASELAQVCGVELLGVLPLDPPAAGRICAGALDSKALRRSALLAAAATVAARLVARLEDQPASAPGPMLAGEEAS